MSLNDFLQEIDNKQVKAYREIPLFDNAKTSQWTKEQRKHFVKIFYHTRGHFDRLLWTRLIYAPNAEAKKRMLQYMAEEAGLPDLYGNQNLNSHEILFGRFAERLGVELTHELTEEEGYLPFAKEFNNGLVKWFREKDWESGVVGFSAYERLDNVDYGFMYDFARSLNIPEKALEFFIVHKQADHFDKTSNELPEIWKRDPTIVRDAFSFIYEHQQKMWKNLSDSVFNYR